MQTATKQPKLNIPHLVIGLIIISCAVCYGFIASMNHQAEYTATAFNTASQISSTLTKEPVQKISSEQVQGVFNSQSSIGLVNSMGYTDFITTSEKVIIILTVTIGVFMMLNMCGCVPRMGACE